MLFTADVVAAAAQLACLLEASAEKPGNVTPTHAFYNMNYGDFLRSAVAIGPILSKAGDHPVGETILAAIEATHYWTQANTNLGMVLLLVPLARAALVGALELRTGLSQVLRTLTVDDAQKVYTAIRLVMPGGFETKVEHDIRTEPTVTFYEAMVSAAERDSIAAEYANDYAITFEHGLPLLQSALSKGLNNEQAIIQTYLELLAAVPDTLIARKCGLAMAQTVADRAAQTLATGGIFTSAGRRAISALDAYLRQDDKNRLNPGTTADLIAATLFVALLEGILK